MSGVDALARVLRSAGVETGYVGGEAFRQKVAERILADPGPLLEALAEAGVLERHNSSRPGCRDCSMYRRGHIHRRYVTEWEVEDARG